MGGPQSPEVLWRVADRARPHPEVDHEGVLGRHPPCRPHGAARRSPTSNSPRVSADLVDDLGAVGAEPTAALVGVGPPLGDLGRGVGQQGDVEHDRGHPGLADLAALHRPGQQWPGPRPTGTRTRGGGRCPPPRRRPARSGPRRRRGRRASRRARACRRRWRPGRWARGCGVGWRRSPRPRRRGRGPRPPR